MEELLAKYFSGEVTGEEASDVERWKSESIENSQEFMEAKIIWLSAQQIPTPPLAKVLEGIIDRSGEYKNKIVKMNRSGWLKYAVVAIVVAALGFILTFTLSKRSISEKSEQNLDDGSVIYLDDRAMITSVSITDEIREVKMSGRGHFNIARDESRPFVVITNDARIEVLGTSFLVDTRDNRTEVRVGSGLVTLVKPGEGNNQNLTVRLKEGEYGAVSKNKKGIIKRNNNDPNYLSWKTKIIEFDQSGMSEVKATLEDVYGINVVFTDPDLKNCRLTAKFNKKGVKDAIEIIARTFNLSFQFTNGTAVLTGKGC